VVSGGDDGKARIWACDLCGVPLDGLLARAHERLDATR